MSRTILAARLAGAGVLAAGGTAAGQRTMHWVQQELGEDAVSRTMSFYSVALPALLEYKGLEWRGLPEEESNQRFDELHAKWAPKFRDKYLELRGFYLKQGQAIATNISDLAPKVWQDTMEPLLDRVPPVPIQRIREIMIEELGSLDAFEYIEEVPLGSASIGQVHRAIWSPDGKTKKQCVVKIMYPEVEKCFRGDVHAVKRICKEMFPQYYVAFEEIEKQFQSEFDYRLEAENTEAIRRHLQSSPYRKQFIVPQIFKSTKRVLIMEEIPQAVPLTHALREAAQIEVSRRGLDDIQTLMDIENEREVSAASKGHIVKSSFLSRVFTALYFRFFGSPLLIEPSRLVDQLLLVHGHQILIDGIFSSDPHPGNLLLNAQKKIALIDFGQAKKLDRNTRIQLAKLILLVEAAVKSDPRISAQASISKEHRRARKAVAAAMTDAGFRTKTNDVDCLYELASVYFGRDDRVWIWPRNFQQWTEYMEGRDPVVNLADCEHFVMVVRCGMLIRGLGHILHEHRNLASVWKPFATRVLRENGQLSDVTAQIKGFSSAQYDNDK